MPRAWYDASGSAGLMEPTDEELLTAWRRGDLSAMRILVSRHMSTVRGPLSWLIEDTQACEDTVVDVFSSLAESDEPMFPATSLSVGLTRHAVLAGDAWRRSHAAERARQAQALRQGSQASGGPRPQEVVAALAELPTDFFVPLMLRHLENRGIAEIAEVCEKSDRQIWAAIHQALMTADRAIRGTQSTTQRSPGAACDHIAILRMLEDDLPARERDRVAAHIARCGDCRAHEWRLSTLLAFLGSISGMKRRRDDPTATWERIVERARSGSSRARTSVVLRRGASVVAAMSLVATVILVVAAIASRPTPAAPQKVVVAPVTDEDGGTLTKTTVAPPDGKLNLPQERAESEGPAVTRPQVETAWLPLPEFAGDPSKPSAADLQPAQASPVTGREPVVAPEAAVAPTEPGKLTTTANPSMPTRAGWSRSAALPRAGRRSRPQDTAPPEPDARASSGPERSEIVIPQPPRFNPPQPVLPRIVRGAKTAAAGSSVGTEPPAASGESSDHTRSTLAGIVSLLSGFTKPDGKTH